jgi:DNA polymerase-3 subunit delta'
LAATKFIYGHEQQLQVLGNALKQNRIPHTYLFSGMAGIGKKKAAVALAQRIYCTGDFSSLLPCQECPSCRKVMHGNHPDLLFLEPEGQFIRIKAIRDLQEQMQYNPMEGAKRITIIDDADKMNVTSANALLKTLEEPAPNNLMILITSNPSALLRTILSRCQQLRFAPLHRQVIMSYLQDHYDLTEEEYALFAAASGGSIRGAVAMAEGDYKNIRDKIFNSIGVIDQMAPLDLFAFIAEQGKDRENILEKLEMILQCYRDVLVFHEIRKEECLINRDRMDIIGPMADRLDAQKLLSRLRAVEYAYHAIRQNANKALTLDMMMFKLAH